MFKWIWISDNSDICYPFPILNYTLQCPKLICPSMPLCCVPSNAACTPLLLCMWTKYALISSCILDSWTPIYKSAMELSCSVSFWQAAWWRWCQPAWHGMTKVPTGMACRPGLEVLNAGCLFSSSDTSSHKQTDRASSERKQWCTSTAKCYQTSDRTH